MLFTFHTGCDTTNEEAEREPNRNIVGLVSDGIYNTVTEVFELSVLDANGWGEGSISAVITGELDNSAGQITLSLAEEPDLLLEYNRSMFGTEVYRYAQSIPQDRYVIENTVLAFQQGQRDGQFKIRVQVLGLSPDVSYFIPLRIDKTSANELDLRKNTVLYEIQWKNEWATTQSIPKYNHTGNKTLLPGSISWESSSLQKEVFPLSADAVRIVAGDRELVDAEDVRLRDIYEKWAITLSVSSAGDVTISPWSDSPLGMNLEQLDDDDPEYPNEYREEFNEITGRTSKVFRLNYKYYDPDEQSFFWMKEELRIEE